MVSVAEIVPLLIWILAPAVSVSCLSANAAVITLFWTGLVDELLIAESTVIVGAVAVIVPSLVTVMVVPSGFTLPATEVVAIGTLASVPLVMLAVVVP